MRKKAALCLLRLLRKSPQDQEIMVPDVWSVKLVSTASTCPFRVWVLRLGFRVSTFCVTAPIGIISQQLDCAAYGLTGRPTT